MQRGRASGRAFALTVSVASAVVYGLLAVLQHARFRTTGYDLGIFEQAIRGYAHLRAPTVPLKGPSVNILGDHFSPIIAVLAPLYRLIPSAYTLLIAQALLVAGSVYCVARAAARVIEGSMARVIPVCYALSWGLQSLVGFDFHEVAFGVLLMAWALERLVAGRPQHAAVLALMLLLVKEDLGLTVAAFGIVLWLLGSRRLGWRLGLAGIAGFVLTVAVLIPALNKNGTYSYVGPSSAGVTATSSHPSTVLRSLVKPRNIRTKATTLLLLLVPTLFIAVRSRYIILLLPTLGWRFLSTHEGHWLTKYQYDAVLMPVVFVGLIDGWNAVDRRLRQRNDRHRRAGTAVAAATCVAVALALSLHYPLHRLLEPSLWKGDAVTADASRAVSAVPDDAVVEATNQLSPHLTSRDIVYTVGGAPAGTAQWVVLDVERGDFLSTAAQQRDYQAALLASGAYTEVTEAGRFVVLHQRP
ncbi:MAG: hypothetical protein QOD72_1018 [Acidimicrobiaceae bacterium]|nr:hypothetical protein [Acidimicrobiaceae bacterium]